MGTLAVLCDRIAATGGAERYWETVITGLAARNIRVRVLARVVDDRAGFAPEVRGIAWADETSAPSADAARAVAAVLRDDPPDVVVTASVFDVAVLDEVRANARRWIVRVHDHRAFCPTGDRVYPQFEDVCASPMGGACRAAAVVRGCVHGPRASSFQRITARETLRNRLRTADGVLVSSEHMRQTCVANGIDARRIEITPPPLPDDAYASTPAPRPRVPTVLFASRLTPRKGLRSLLAALARLPRAERPRLVIAGEGEAEEREARAQAARDGIEADWRGKLSSAEMRDAIDGADVVAVPSLWPEPFGLVGIEAQARGRPAVAYQAGGIGEWIEGAGIAVRRGDEASLAGAIRQILDEGTWRPLAEGARRRAEEYRVRPHLDRLLHILGTNGGER
jgi:glycosyltransferase involved in cell wall biosynthesis